MKIVFLSLPHFLFINWQSGSLTLGVSLTAVTISFILFKN